MEEKRLEVCILGIGHFCNLIKGLASHNVCPTEKKIIYAICIMTIEIHLLVAGE